MPADANCKRCGGTGHIFVDSLNAKRCICLQRSLYARKLGMHLYRVPPAKNSSLLKKLKTNTFLVVDDDDINPHLKSAFIKLGLNARWAYVTDTDVLQAFLGNPNSISAQNVAEIAEYPFLVLRLGVQGYKNIALSGVICELLMLRLISFRTTWIVSPRPLTEQCLEWSDELDNLLRRNFESNGWKRKKDEAHRPEARVAAIRAEVIREKVQAEPDWEDTYDPDDDPDYEPEKDLAEFTSKRTRNGEDGKGGGGDRSHNSRTNNIIKDFKL